MSGYWLQTYLIDAVSRNVCTTIGCTTCAAHEFRDEVLTAWANATGRRLRRELDRGAVTEITTALAAVDPPRAQSWEFTEAVRCLLYDLWSGIPILDAEIETILKGSWSGRVLQEMQEHHARVQAERRAFDEL